MLDVRGNVPTRLAKLDRGEYDALILACAGLQRLGLAGRVAERLAPQVLMPAPGQGAIAVEARAGDAAACALLRAIDHRPTRLSTTAERACLGSLDGGCLAPVGALASWAGDVLTVTAVVTSSSGDRVVRACVDAAVLTPAEAEAAGVRLAERLLQQGAGAILAEARWPARGGRAAGKASP
jgi:hydroxymethylbilane synthase